MDFARQLEPDEVKVRDAFFSIKLEDPKFHRTPDIPSRMVSNASQNFLYLAPDEMLLGFYDDTPFDSGRAGFALTTRRIYARGMWGTPQGFPYWEIKEAKLADANRIMVPPLGQIWSLSDGRVLTAITQFLNEVKTISQPSPLLLPSVLTTDRAATMDRIGAVCQANAHGRLRCGVQVGDVLLVPFRNQFKLPRGSVFAFWDKSLLGSSSDGLAICHDGLRWTNRMRKSRKGDAFLPWRHFAGVEIDYFGSRFIAIGTGPHLGLKQKRHRVACLKFLTDLQRSIQEVLPPPSPRSTETASLPRPIMVEKRADAVRAALEVNQATLDQLLALPEIPVLKVHELVQRRDWKPFQNLDEVEEFLQLKPHQWVTLRDKIEVRVREEEALKSSARFRVVDY